MSLEYLAGQILTADELQKSVPNYVELGTTHSIASSTTLEETGLEVTVDDLVKITLDIRWRDGGGGIVWDWLDTGSVTLHSRATLSAGESTSGGSGNIADIRLIQFLSLGTNQSVANFSSVTSHRVQEELIVSGEGTVTFRFAQETSNATPTEVFPQSYIVWQYLAE